MEIHIKTLHGLEDVLAEEVRELGGSDIRIQKRSISCSGDLEFLYKANFHLRTALRILVPILKFKARTEQELYNEVYKHDWSQYFSIHQTFAIDNTIFSDFFRHSKYAALKTKDAIVDKFRNTEGKRPSIDTKAPDIQLDLFASQDQFIISLDSSGSTLNQRGYRVDNHQAPLNEVLAAGLLKLAGWNKSVPLIDPMCGTGTILIEAALMAQNIPPQQFRKDFAFKSWKNFQPMIWNRIMAEGRSAVRKSPLNISGGDIDSGTVLTTNRTLKKLGLLDIVNVRHVAMENHKPSAPNGMIISNPPYGERIGRTNTNEFYKAIGDSLKNNFTGFDAWLISSNMEAFKHVRLKPSKKIVLFNGSLECKFQKYEMYRGSKEDKITS